MKLINKFIKFIDKVSDVVGKIGSWSILIIMFLVVYEVIKRRIFNAPTIWSFEIVTMFFGTYFMIVASYGLLHKSHVAVDTIYEKFSDRGRAILEIISYLLLYFPFVISIFYFSLRTVGNAWAIKETSSSLFGAPVYLFKTVIPITFGLLILQGISQVLKQIVILTVKEQKEHPEKKILNADAKTVNNNSNLQREGSV